MKVGIDSYSFHRYFGEIYEGLQTDPGKRWKMEGEFLDFAIQQGVDEVALESCFFDAMDDGLVNEIKARLDEAGIAPVLGWGHPDGLHGGADKEALRQLLAHIPQARKMGCSVMGIRAASMLYADVPRESLLEASVEMLKVAAKAAAAEGIILGLENHIDFTSSEIAQMVEAIGSDSLKVNFDTGNTLRKFEDPVEAAKRLAPYAVSTHTKDIITLPKGGNPSEHFTYWPSAPAGQWLIDMLGVVKALGAGGFKGALTVELDLVGPQFVNKSEEELVAESIEYLRDLIRLEA
jgi:sugar phosphate isomerase/epimerase